MSAKMKGLDIHIRTEFDNMDTETMAIAIVRDGDTEVARARVASGEVPEHTNHQTAYIPFDDLIDPSNNMTIEIVHPGISSNPEPHWRMTFTLSAIMTDNTERACQFSLASASNFSDKKFGHLNFVDDKRRSGAIQFRLS